MDDLQYALEFLRFAEMDLGSAKFLLGYRPLPIEIICYHCQQSAEKCLKYLLLLNKTEPPKTHDLLKLCKLCEQFILNVQEILPKCVELNKYGVLPRYPHELPVDESDTKTAINYAENILAFTKKQNLLPAGHNPGQNRTRWPEQRVSRNPPRSQ